MLQIVGVLAIVALLAVLVVLRRKDKAGSPTRSRL